MSLINRIALANLSNTEGAADSQWRPRYRYEILDFGGHSSVINLANGGGKTTLANAVIGLLSRHRGLLNRTKEHAAPSRDGRYSHVQIELVTPTGSVNQRDLLMEVGEEVTGEKWVFGMAMHGEGDNQFYFYPGKLEDCPPGFRDDEGKINIFHNTRFETAAKALKGLEWGVGLDAWKTQISLHIPFDTLVGLAEFQVKGGADKDAPIFKLAERKDEEGKRIHEGLDERFFYEILAPELLSDVFEKTEGEGEKTADQHLFEEARVLVQTRHALERKENQVELMSIAMDLLRDAADAGSAAVKAKERYDEAMKGRVLDMAVLHHFVRQQPAPGVPFAICPEGKIGDVAAKLIIVPGESTPRIPDTGLGVILGKSAGVVNQAAARIHKKGRKIPQVVEIPCDSYLEDAEKSGPKPNYYTLAMAEAILRKQGNPEDIETLDDAVNWFCEQSDTNPYRAELTEIELEKLRTETSIDQLNTRIEKLRTEALDLSRAQKEVKANEQAYNGLVESGLFSEGELKEPNLTADKVGQEYRDAQLALQQHQVKCGQLTDFLPDWNEYQAQYDGRDPLAIDEELSAKREQAIFDRDKNREWIDRAEADRTKAEKTLADIKSQTVKKEQEISEFEKLSKEAAPVLSALRPEESAIGMEQRIRDVLSENEEKLRICQKNLEYSRTGVQHILKFQKHFPDQAPDEWIKSAEQQRRALISDQNTLTNKLNNQLRERKDLESNPIAAGEVSNQGLELISEAGIVFKDLHSFVTGLDLSDDRRKDLLGMFSSLLFAPVVDSEIEATNALKVLDQEDLPIPVFHARNLQDFCQNGKPIDALDYSRSGLFFGTITRRVECILDPGLVQRERDALDLKISESKLALNEIDKELEDLDPEGEIVTLARNAAVAVAEGLEKRLPELEEHYRQLTEVIANSKNQLTNEMIKAMRSAEEFERSGGSSHFDFLSEETTTLRKETEAQNAVVNQLENEILELRRARDSLEELVNSVYPDAIRQLVGRAIRFVEKNGPEFMENAEEIETELKRIQEKADDRRLFARDCTKAQAWLDYQQKLGTEDGIDDRLARAQQGIDESVKAREGFQAELKELENREPAQREKVEAIDLAALALMRQLKKALAAGDISMNFQVTESDIDNHPIGNAAWALSESIHGDSVIETANSFVDTIDSLDLDADMSRLIDLSNKAKITEKDFVSKAESAAAIEYGLSDIERQRLLKAKGVDTAQHVEEVANEYWQHLSREKEEFESLDQDEKAVSMDFGERIAMLLDSANDNLTALKKVAKENPSDKMVSHFLVDATVADNKEISGMIGRIVSLVDLEEQKWQKMEEMHFDVGVEQKDLQEKIRKILYRGVFTKVSVRFANQHIRPGAKPEKLSKNLSTGEKNALLMMWVLRLAKYRIEREAQKRHSTISRRRARTQSQSIMIIDGLFSNLSEPKLIRSVMSSLTGTRGNFQLIGLVHDPKYQHDFDLFPTFLIGNRQENGRWVNFKRMDEQGALAFAKLQVGRRAS